MPGVITYNLQRKTDTEGVQRTIDAVNKLRSTYPDALLCLQEVSPEVSWAFSRIHRVVHGENMMIAPEGWGLFNESSIPGENGFRSFLACQLFFQNQVFNVVTGKLPHGISPSAFRSRPATFSRLLQTFPSKWLIVTLDTNAYSAHEQSHLVKLAGARNLHASHSPQGTYDLSLLEPSTLLHKMAARVGRIIPFCPELDFIFYDAALRCEKSGIIDTSNISDHKPVFISLSNA